MRERLARIAECCREGKPLESADSVALAMAITEWLAGSCSTLDEAFGVKRRGGQRSNITISKLLTRNALIRQCAAQHFGNNAAEITKAALRYESGAWRLDRKRSQMPAHYANTPRAVFFEIMSRFGALPNSERHFRRILQRDSADTNQGGFMSSEAG